MDFHILIAQRKESYEGEYGLEDLGSMTEYEESDNPAYLPDTEAEMRATGEFDRMARITIELDEDAIKARLEQDEPLAWQDTPQPKEQLGVRVLFGVRKGTYAGQYGLESFASMDEYGVDANPDYLLDKAKEAVESKEFASLGFVDIGIDSAQLKAILYPEAKPVSASLL